MKHAKRQGKSVTTLVEYPDDCSQLYDMSRKNRRDVLSSHSRASEDSSPLKFLSIGQYLQPYPRFTVPSKTA
jgi:hypothetical protein